MQVMDEHPDYARNDKHDRKDMDRNCTLDEVRRNSICKKKIESIPYLSHTLFWISVTSVSRLDPVVSLTK